MDYVKVKSYAKINLTLDITGACGGYHMLDSVVASVDLFDVIAVKKRRKDSIVSVAMHGRGSEDIPFDGNNAVKAAEAFIRRYSTCGVDVAVWKNIPMGAGLGGSSADVAGVLNAMKKLFGADEEGVRELAEELGSDCGYMLRGGFARLRGRGERVEPLPNGLRLDLGILVPKSGVSTAACYREYDRLSPPSRFTSDRAAEAIRLGDKFALARSLSNGLTLPATFLNAEVEEAYSRLAAFDPLGVNMTGSGSAVYAVFENDSFARYAQSRYRGNCEFILSKTINPVRKEKDGGRKID